MKTWTNENMYKVSVKTREYPVWDETTIAICIVKQQHCCGGPHAALGSGNINIRIESGYCWTEGRFVLVVASWLHNRVTSLDPGFLHKHYIYNTLHYYLLSQDDFHVTLFSLIHRMLGTVCFCSQERGSLSSIWTEKSEQKQPPTWTSQVILKMKVDLLPRIDKSSLRFPP